MTRKPSARELRDLGLDWPRHPLVEKHCVVEEGKVDLERTLASLQSSRAFYRGQINEAFRFKQQTGADYSEFTDRFDEYVRMERALGVAIAYVEEVIAAAAGLDA
jgi:hypothetical protein